MKEEKAVAEAPKDTPTDESNTPAPMASISDMFSFARTQRCRMLISISFVFAAITGSVFPGTCVVSCMR